MLFCCLPPPINSSGYTTSSIVILKSFADVGRFHCALEIYADALLLSTSCVASSGMSLRGCYTLEGHRAVYS